MLLQVELVLDRDDTVAFVDVKPDYSTRTEPAAVLVAVRAVV